MASSHHFIPPRQVSARLAPLVWYKELRMCAGCRRHTCSGKGWRGWGVEKMVRRYHHHCMQLVVVMGVGVKNSAKWWKSWRHTSSGKGRRVAQDANLTYLQIITAVIVQNKSRTWRKYMRTPQDSESVITVQGNAKLRAKSHIFLLPFNLLSAMNTG